jgi:hypothetical protein
MSVSPERERVIRTAWKARGADQWDREVHGRGLASLNIQASTNMRTAKSMRPITPYDNLEFRLVQATTGNVPIYSIVCEGVVVETWASPQK